MKPNNFIGILGAALVFSVVVQSQPSLAADYPPSIETLEVGKPLAVALTPKESGTTAVVPVATSDSIPVLIGESVSIFKSKLTGKTLSNSTVESTPIKLSTSLTLGGIGADEKAPLASISRSKKSEVQIPVDVPTRIALSGFKASSRGTATFVDATGRSIPLGNIFVSSSGKITIPALTFSKANVSYKIKITVNGMITTFAIRSTM